MATYSQIEDLLTVDFEQALEQLIIFAETLKEKTSFWIDWYDKQIDEAKRAHKMIYTELYGPDPEEN